MNNYQMGTPPMMLMQGSGFNGTELLISYFSLNGQTDPTKECMWVVVKMMVPFGALT